MIIATYFNWNLPKGCKHVQIQHVPDSNFTLLSLPVIYWESCSHTVWLNCRHVSTCCRKYNFYKIYCCTSSGFISKHLNDSEKSKIQVFARQQTPHWRVLSAQAAIYSAFIDQKTRKSNYLGMNSYLMWNVESIYIEPLQPVLSRTGCWIPLQLQCNCFINFSSCILCSYLPIKACC